jgi:hypothetical protein
MFINANVLATNVILVIMQIAKQFKANNLYIVLSSLHNMSFVAHVSKNEKWWKNTHEFLLMLNMYTINNLLGNKTLLMKSIKLLK